MPIQYVDNHPTIAYDGVNDKLKVNDATLEQKIDDLNTKIDAIISGDSPATTLTELSGSSLPLVEGTAIIGKVSIDQTEPGTTNRVVTEIIATERKIYDNKIILAGAVAYSSPTPGITDLSKNSKVYLLIKPNASQAYSMSIRRRLSDGSLVDTVSISASATDTQRTVTITDLSYLKCDWSLKNDGATDQTFNAWEVLR